MKNKINCSQGIIGLIAFLSFFNSFSANGQVKCIPDSVIYGTYIGGSGTTEGNAIIRDKSGNTYVAGVTSSTYGIATKGAYQSVFGGGSKNAFLSKFDCSGNIVWATYFGGSGDDDGLGVNIDDSGNVYMVGHTSGSSGLATSGAYQTSNGGIYDGFITKFTSSGSLLWATYFGGAENDIAWGVVTDNSGNVYVAGSALSTSGIATSGAYQSSFAGPSGGSQGDAFLAKFDKNGSRLIWATYYGGTDEDVSTGLIIDAVGSLYIKGVSWSTSGMASSGAFQTSNGGGEDGFLAKFNGNGARIWGTYFGGSGDDADQAVALDISGNIYITGFTASASGIASSGSYQSAYGGGNNDAFLAKFDSAGARLWATYYGGYGDDLGYGVCTDNTGNVYFSGTTSGSSGMATSGAYQTSNAGSYDAFAAKFSSSGSRLYSTYYGGGNDDYVSGMSSGDSGNVYIAGFTSSASGIATSGAYETFYGGAAYNAYFAKIYTAFNKSTGISGIVSPLTNNYISAAPNPFSSTLSVSYSLPQYENIHLTISDITGKQIATLINENQNQGQHIYSLDAEKYNMPAGIYFLRMVAGNETMEEKIIKIK